MSNFATSMPEEFIVLLPPFPFFKKHAQFSISIFYKQASLICAINVLNNMDQKNAEEWQEFTARLSLRYFLSPQAGPRLNVHKFSVI